MRDDLGDIRGVVAHALDIGDHLHGGGNVAQIARHRLLAQQQGHAAVSYTHLAKDLNLWYGDFKALKSISLDVGEREITALIGPSGCGKSAFLKTLNRMNDLVPGVRIEGDVRLKGEDIFAREMELTDLRRRVGMVFQKANPFPMSIYDNITRCI